MFSLADLKMNRLLDTFDEWALTSGRDGRVRRARALRADAARPASPRLQLDLRSGEIRTVVWATGFRPDYGWLDVPVVDEKGQLRHEGGVVDSPGLYALGLPVLRRRKSTFIYGIEDDAREVIDHLAGYLARAVIFPHFRRFLAYAEALHRIRANAELRHSAIHAWPDIRRAA